MTSGQPLGKCRVLSLIGEMLGFGLQKLTSSETRTPPAPVDIQWIIDKIAFKLCGKTSILMVSITIIGKKIHCYPNISAVKSELDTLCGKRNEWLEKN